MTILFGREEVTQKPNLPLSERPLSADEQKTAGVNNVEPAGRTAVCPWRGSGQVG